MPCTYRVLTAHAVCSWVSLQLADKKQRRKQSTKQITEAHRYRVINQQPLQKTGSRPSHGRQPSSLPQPSLMPHVMLIQNAFQNNTEQHNGCSAQHNLKQTSAILIVQHNLMFGHCHLWCMSDLPYRHRTRLATKNARKYLMLYRPMQLLTQPQ